MSQFTNQRTQRYKLLMQEIKRRLEVVDRILTINIGLHQIVEVEICYVQYRKICELIALACLTAHDDILSLQTKTLLGETKPSKIFAKIESIHPRFFPVPGMPRHCCTNRE